MPIDPIQAVRTEFTVPSLAELEGAAPTEPGGGFGGALSDQMAKLGEMLEASSAQSQALAAGEAPDVATVVMEVERAALALQLAVQVRNRAVEAYQDLWRTQI